MKKGSKKNILMTSTASLILVAVGLTGYGLTDSVATAQQQRIEKTLKRGMSGSQVTNLVVGLDNADYLNAEDVTNVKGNYIYDEAVEKAVVHFQNDLGIRMNGVYDTVLDEILFSFWRPEYTSCRLGNRMLTTSQPKAGADVDLLIEILNEAGFPPDSTKLRLSKKVEFTVNEKRMFDKAGSSKGEVYAGTQHHYYSKDIEKALMAFQAFNGIKPSGELNAATVRALSDTYLRTKDKKPSSYDAKPEGLEKK